MPPSRLKVGSIASPQRGKSNKMIHGFNPLPSTQEKVTYVLRSRSPSLPTPHHTVKASSVTDFASKRHLIYGASVTINLKRTRDDERVEFRVNLMFSVELIPGAISEILASVTDTGSLTVADRYGLMAAILDERLPEEDRNSVNRLLRSAIKGRIKIVNELSAIG